MAARDRNAEQLEAQLRESEARLDLLQAQAESRRSTEEMAEISGLRAAQDEARNSLAELKRESAAKARDTRRKVETALQHLQDRIDRAQQKYTAWDDARERRMYARLDEADARLRIWKSQADQARAEDRQQFQDDLSRLKDRINETRARAKEAHDRDNREAQAALEEAAREFDEAFDEAERRFES